MAKTTYAAIDPAIWDKPWFIDAPNPYKLVFIWLLTNKHKNCTGIYEVHLRRIAEGSLQTLEDTQAALEHFTQIGKAYYEDGYIIIANWHKRTHFNNQDVRNFVINHLSTLPTSLTTNHPDIISALLDKCGQGGRQTPGQGGRQGRIVNMNMNMNRNRNNPPTPPVKTETGTFTKADEAEDELWEKKGYGNIAEAVGVKDKMWVRVSWIDRIQATYPNTYKDAVKKALRKQAEEGRKMANPEGYIEAILVNKNGGKYNGKKK